MANDPEHGRGTQWREAGSLKDHVEGYLACDTTPNSGMSEKETFILLSYKEFGVHLSQEQELT